MPARSQAAGSNRDRCQPYSRSCATALPVALPGTLVTLLLYFSWRTAVDLSFQHPPPLASAALAIIVAAFLWLYGRGDPLSANSDQAFFTRTLHWEWLAAVVVGWMVMKCSLFAMWNVPSRSASAPLAGYVSAPLGWLPVLLSSTIAIPLIEEVFLRGFIQGRLGLAFGRGAAIAMTVGLSAVLHKGSAGLPLIVAGALVTGSMVVLFGSVWAAVLVHSAGNLALGLYAVLPGQIDLSGVTPSGGGALLLLVVAYGCLVPGRAKSAGDQYWTGIQAAPDREHKAAGLRVSAQAAVPRAHHAAHPLPEAK